MDRSRISITRHAGKLWEDIPSSFVKWAVEEAKNFNGYTLEKLMEEYEKRGLKLIEMKVLKEQERIASLSKINKEQIANPVQEQDLAVEKKMIFEYNPDALKLFRKKILSKQRGNAVIKEGIRYAFNEIEGYIKENLKLIEL